MPWMIFQADLVAVKRISWMMPGMIIQGDHVAVQGFPWMMPWMIIQLFKATFLRYKDFDGRCHG